MIKNHETNYRFIHDYICVRNMFLVHLFYTFLFSARACLINRLI